MKQYLKPTLIIVGVILLATTISRVINNSESLTEYAERNKSPNVTETTSVSPETEPATNSTEDMFETPASTETDIASTGAEFHQRISPKHPTTIQKKMLLFHFIMNLYRKKSLIK